MTGLYFTPPHIVNPAAGTGGFLRHVHEGITGNPPYGGSMNAKYYPLLAETWPADDGSTWCTVTRPRTADPESGPCIDFPFACIDHLIRLLTGLQAAVVPSTDEPADVGLDAVLLVILRLRNDILAELGRESRPYPCLITSEKWQEADGAYWCGLVQPFENIPGATERFDFRADEIDHFIQLLTGLKSGRNPEAGA